MKEVVFSYFSLLAAGDSLHKFNLDMINIKKQREMLGSWQEELTGGVASMRCY